MQFFFKDVATLEGQSQMDTWPSDDFYAAIHTDFFSLYYVHDEVISGLKMKKRLKRIFENIILFNTHQNEFFSLE